MTNIATALGALVKPKCITDRIQTDAQGQPICSVVEDLTSMNETKQVVVPSCTHSGGKPPCWTLEADTTMCPDGGKPLKMNQDQAAMNASTVSSSISCSLCLPGSTAPGC